MARTVNVDRGFCVHTSVLSGAQRETMGGKTKGQVALTNLTLLATISSDRKGREGNHA